MEPLGDEPLRELGSLISHELAVWLASNDDEAAVCFRRAASDLYIADLEAEELHALRARLQLYLEILEATHAYQGVKPSAHSQHTLLLLSLTVIERAWIARSLSPYAARLRSLEQQVMATAYPDEALMSAYALTLRVARNSGVVGLNDVVADDLLRLATAESGDR